MPKKQKKKKTRKPSVTATFIPHQPVARSLCSGKIREAAKICVVGNATTNHDDIAPRSKSCIRRDNRKVASIYHKLEKVISAMHRG